MKINHIGYAVQNIDKSISDFYRLGYQPVGKRVRDISRNLWFQFISNDEICIELVQTIDEEKDSSVKGIIERNRGGIPYHICYEVDDILENIETMKGLGGYILLDYRTKEESIHGNASAFLYNRNMGMVELWEKSNE